MCMVVHDALPVTREEKRVNRCGARSLRSKTRINKEKARVGTKRKKGKRRKKGGKIKWPVDKFLPELIDELFSS